MSPGRIEMLDLVEYGEQTMEKLAKSTATPIENQRTSAGAPSGRDTRRLVRDRSRDTTRCAVEILRLWRTGSRHSTLSLANGPPEQITWTPLRRVISGQSVESHRNRWRAFAVEEKSRHPPFVVRGGRWQMPT
jgi:hypothetical protein